jgi:RNA polymerase sigma factor (sigma-70 family)
VAAPATEGDGGRIDRLLQHLDAFVAFARRRIADPALAEDLVQDALVKALAHVHEVRDDERLDAWFYRILRRMIADLGSRSERGRNTRLPDQVAPDEDQPAACACLHGLVDDLVAGQRDAVRLVDLEGLPARAAAERLGITETTLKVRRLRARERLHQMLAGVCGICATHGCVDCHCRSPAPRS